MAINIKFDLAGNPEPPTILLAAKNGNILGQLDVDAESIDMSDKFNEASEFSFTLNKFVDNKITSLWDKVVNFKLVYCEEWNMWFEITVELDEETETIKTVFCTQLGQAELSQLMLHNIEINTEADIARDDYKITILYDENDKEASCLDRMLKDKAPHYRIAHVDPSIAKLQRSFSFDDTSICDGFQEIAEEIGCLFDYPSNSSKDRKICRDIYVYDLQQNCNDCGHRGEFRDKCPKCGSTNIKQGYGKDTLIFVTSDELASEGIELKTDTDAIKNCFKLEAGDDLMIATVRNCNPNGTDYIWRFSDEMKSDMSEELVAKLKSYDEKYKDYYDNYESLIDSDIIIKYNTLVEKYDSRYCKDCGHVGHFKDMCPKCKSLNIELQLMPTSIKGYSSLMNAYYNIIDLSLYLESALMPSVELSETTAKEQADLLTSSFISSVAVNNENIESVSLATADSAVLSIAKIIVKSTYKVEIGNSEYDKDTKTWSGNFVITNYSDEDDVSESKIINVVINNKTETFIKQKIDKALNKENTNDYSISGLFKMEYNDFCNELKKYALNPLKSFYDACDACLSILIDQGAGNENDKSDLYKSLYQPYYQKSSAISNEILLREEEIKLISGEKGVKQYVEDCRNNIHSYLNFQDYLGEELWLEFCCYRREDKYSNENYISDGLNNAELFKKASEFFELAGNEIYKSSESQHSISTTLNNLLAIPKFKKLVESFNVGNWIRVQVDEEIYRLRLLEYDISFGDFDNISVEFSDVSKVKNGITDVQNVLNQASSMATSYNSVKRQASQGEESKETVDKWLLDGLNSAQVRIQSNDTEDIVLGKNGLLCRSYDEINDVYSPEQLRITHNIIAYTDDDWLTVRQAIGKHNYRYFNDNKELVDGVGYGLSAEFVTAGYITGSQIIGGDIYSDNYSTINSTGSYLNLRDGTFSFGGGALTFDGKRLWLDSPDIPTDESISNIATEITSDYLKTTNVYAQNLQVNSAKIQGKLTASQIDVSDVITVGGIAETSDIPTNVSQLNNDSGYETAASIKNTVITKNYIETLNIHAGSVDAENISGTTISGKSIIGGSLLIGNKDNTYAEITDSGALSCNGASISGNFQQYSNNGYKSVGISDNEIKFYSWETNGDYVGSIKSLRNNNDNSVVGIGLFADTGDNVWIGYRPNSNDNTVKTAIGIISSDIENGKPPYIVNTKSCTLSPITGLSLDSNGVINRYNKVKITVVNGLITDYVLMRYDYDKGTGTWKESIVETTDL